MPISVGILLLTLGLTGQLGSVSGRVVFEGEIPILEIDPGNDSCCVQAEPKDERFVVGPEKGLANVVVLVKMPQLESDSQPIDPVVVHNENCAFRPRVAIVRVGQPFVMANADPTTHNMNAKLRRNGHFNLVLPPEDRREIVFDQAETKPAILACNIHPFMRGYLFVLDHPHFALTDESGRFAIVDLPGGALTLQFWHEGSRLTEMEIASSTGELWRTDERGELHVDLSEDEEIELGDLRVQLAEN